MLHQPTYAPVPMLAADVNCFWALEQDQESYNREVYLPDAYIEVMINVGAPLMLESEYGMLELPRAFVNPLQNKLPDDFDAVVSLGGQADLEYQC